MKTTNSVSPKRLKRHLYIVVSLLILCTGHAQAQRYLPSMRGVELRSGAVDGKLNGENFYSGVAMSTYTKNGNRWVLGGEYLQKGYEYKDLTIPLAQFTAEAGYYIKLLADPSKTFFLSLGGSALAGYETVNWGEKLLPDGATILNKDAFVYGGTITLELETYLTDRIVLLINARERILTGSSASKFATQLGFGLKFIIN